MRSTGRVPSEATSDMTRISAIFRMKTAHLPELYDGHSAVRPYPAWDFIRGDSCDWWANCINGLAQTRLQCRGPRADEPVSFYNILTIDPASHSARGASIDPETLPTPGAVCTGNGIALGVESERTDPPYLRDG
jgi:hypothetical protein